ncbi:MAG: energy transducer TonB [Pseudomonadota bacterium]
MSLSDPLRHRLKALGTALLGEARYRPLTSNSLDERFNGAVIASMIVHIVVIFGVGFQAANPALFQNTEALEVVLVNARSQSQPLDPDVLAQVSLDGGGEVEEDRRASSPLPASQHESPLVTSPLQQQIAALESKARDLMAQVEADYTIEQRREAAPAPPSPSLPAPASLAEASLEQARLMARISDDYEAYQKRPRRAFVGARAQEYSFARYVEDWRIKIERIGNLNYPEAAKRDRIHGSLVLTVNIRADGSLEDVQIDRPSGSRILDAAAIKIVQLSAPFPPFSEEMRKKVDILSITRAWQFTASDQLLSK